MKYKFKKKTVCTHSVDFNSNFCLFSMLIVPERKHFWVEREMIPEKKLSLKSEDH